MTALPRVKVPEDPQSRLRAARPAPPRCEGAKGMPVALAVVRLQSGKVGERVYRKISPEHA